MPPQIRVAYDMTFPNRNPAGSGVYATELLEHLKLRDDVTVIPIHGASGGLPNTMRWLLDGAKGASTGSQLVHCPAYVAPWRLPAPLVMTVHDTSTSRFPEDHPLEWRAYARLVLPERARAAVRVLTGTEYTRREIVRELGVSEERVVVTPYGVPERFGSTEHRPPNPDTPLLVFPGAPTRRKNLELVLTAMAASPANGPLRRCRLVITGAAAAQFPNHRDRIEALGLARRVEWRGRVPTDEMPGLMAGADLLVYPSFYEGFGFPALEAMRSQTPVVASNAACLPEVLGTGAEMIDPHDVKAFINAAEAVLSDEQLRKQLVTRGLAQAARYSWSRCAEITTDVYRQALAG